MTRDWKYVYYSPLLQIFVKCSFRVPEWMSFVTKYFPVRSASNIFRSAQGENESLSAMEMFGQLLSASLKDDPKNDETTPSFRWM